ncbi:MAG TPA: DUF2017 domain-containing protein [Candidatus Nanopelagicaceae bacterium]|nr:DUF2017 domain-containing protein [Candidatus Nanopelagicaceae bacterium]
MATFAKTPNGLRLNLDEAETAILRQMATEVLGILSEAGPTEDGLDPLARLVEISTSDELPTDPILARLFPNAYEDDAWASEFRRYTEAPLHRAKQEAITHVLDSLPQSGESDIALDLPAVDEWLRAINDIRLALGVVLDVDENSEERFAQLEDTHPLLFTFQVFNWLGWVLENLLATVTE